MTVTHGYVSVDDLNFWLGSQGVKVIDPGSTPEAERVIEAVSRFVDQRCGRHFWQATATTRTFQASDSYRLCVGDLVSVTSLKTDEDSSGSFETTWSGSDYELLPLNPAAGPEQVPYDVVHAVGSRRFPVGVGQGSSLTNLVQIVGSWGWPAVPLAVEQASLMLAARYYRRKQSPEGVAGFGDFGVIRVGSLLDPDVDRLLAPYRLGVAVAGLA